MRTLLVELDGRGHRFYYVRLLVEYALAERRQVFLLIGDETETKAHLNLHLGRLTDRLNLIEVASPTWKDVERVARDSAADLTLVPDGDRQLLSILRRRGWRGPGRLNLLVMRAHVDPRRSQFEYRLRNSVKQTVLSMVAALPRIRLNVLRSPTWRGRSRYGFVRDPVTFEASNEDVAQVRRLWDLCPERYWFGVLGAISHRKNLPLVVEALRQISGDRALGILVAGAFTDDVASTLPAFKSQLDDVDVALRAVNRLLSDVELDAAVAAVDCVVLAHSNDGPSGLFGKALAASTRVAAAGSRSLRQGCLESPDAASWSPLDRDLLASNLANACRSDRPRSSHENSAVEFARTLLS
ncbi:hypothetical protein SAMN05446589_5532 [Streptomyces sp. OV198]|nr:hypothetical protein SAMN05446589_5532 [Streptomyces sp. OV198]